MKLNEITGKEKAENKSDLIASIKNGKFTKDGSDLEISYSFDCSKKRLTSLVGAPRKIPDGFSCQQNYLTSLEGCPQEVGNMFECDANRLSSLKDIHKHLKKMNGRFYATLNPIESHVLGLLKIKGCHQVTLENKEVQDILNKYLPEGDLLDCQEELIEAGFPEFAQL